MESDVDEVGMIARFIKAKIEQLDKEVRPWTDYTGLDPHILKYFN